MTTQSKIISTVIGFMLLTGAGCFSTATPMTETDTTERTYSEAVSATPTLPNKRSLVPIRATPQTEVASVSYTEALNNYRAKGAYFQFVSCRGNPGSLSIKQGVTFMFDNRDKVARRIAIGKVATYNVGPYGFAVVAAPAAGQYYITCDGGGAALLNVEN